MTTKQIAHEINEYGLNQTSGLSNEQHREVLEELKSMCELQIMAIDDGEIDEE